MSERPDLAGDSSLAGIIALLGFVLVATARVTNMILARGLAGRYRPLALAFFRKPTRTFDDVRVRAAVRSIADAKRAFRSRAGDLASEEGSDRKATAPFLSRRWSDRQTDFNRPESTDGKSLRL